MAERVSRTEKDVRIPLVESFAANQKGKITSGYKDFRVIISLYVSLIRDAAGTLDYSGFQSISDVVISALVDTDRARLS